MMQIKDVEIDIEYGQTAPCCNPDKESNEMMANNYYRSINEYLQSLGMCKVLSLSMHNAIL